MAYMWPEVTFVELWDYWIHVSAAKKFRSQQPLWEPGVQPGVPLDVEIIWTWLLVGTLLMTVNLRLACRDGQNLRM